MNMIEELIKEASGEQKAQKKEKPEKSFLPLFLTVSLVSGLVSGAVGGVLGARYAPQVLSSMQVSQVSPSLDDGKIIKIDEDVATIQVVKKASPSVVSIVIKKDISKLYGSTGPNQLFDNIFQFGLPYDLKLPLGTQEQDGTKTTPPQGKQRIGGGSGFIITSDGLLLTNRHVVADTDAEYTVVLNDGKEFKAKVLAKDPVNDVAIIKIDASNLTPLSLGDSNSIQIGQTVIAIGNTLGEYPNTVTRGVISGINRVVQAGDMMGSTELIQEAIQTDAAISSGNSGGPLLSLEGKVIGINTAVNMEGQSIGFAIPVNGVKRSIESVKKYGRIIRPWLGVRYVPVDVELAKKNNLSVQHGALILGDQAKKELAVIPGSPADKAGLVDGDVIVQVNGQKIEQGHALSNEIAKYSPGDQITLKVVSKGKEKEIRVHLEEFKDQK